MNGHVVPAPSLSLRRITEDDGPELLLLACAYLLETAAHGGEYLPTAENAQRMVDVALDGGRAGDPCYVVVRDGRVVGFGVARGLQDLLASRERVCRELWIYVEPSYRGTWITGEMRQEGLRAAKEAGYDRTDGFTSGRVPTGADFVRTHVTFRHR